MEDVLVAINQHREDFADHRVEAKASMQQIHTIHGVASTIGGHVDSIDKALTKIADKLVASAESGWRSVARMALGLLVVICVAFSIILLRDSKKNFKIDWTKGFEISTEPQEK